MAGSQLRSMLVVAAFALLAFWFRDYMSLRMSPRGKATRRALAYGVAVLVTELLFWAAGVKIGIGVLARRIRSPRILFVLIAFHVAASIPSIWVKRTQSYNWMWATGLIPAPIVWLLLLETTLLSGQGRGVLAPPFNFFGVALLWLCRCSLSSSALATPRCRLTISTLRCSSAL